MRESSESTTSKPSRTGVFMRRLGSALVIWTVIVTVMLSGNRAVTDFVLLSILIILAAGGLAEFYDLLKKREHKRFKWWGIAGGTVLILATFLQCTGRLGLDRTPSAVNNFETVVLVLFVLGLGIRQLFSSSHADVTVTLSATLFGLLYVPWLLNFLQKIYFLPGPESQGIYYLLYVILVTKLGDTGAYVAGSLFGKHQMIPRISPGKTWEGFGGAILVSTVTSLACASFTGERMADMPLLHAAVLGVILGLAAVAGDLVESLFKRDAGAKDSGCFAPGIGGILDLVDSLLFTAPVMYLYLRYILPAA